MDKLSRVIFAILLFLLSVSGVIGASGHSAIAPVTVAKAQDRFSVVAPALVGDGIQIDERPWVYLSDHDDNERIPCESLQITAAGAICDGYRLDFPEVIMKDVLEEGNHLPRKSESVFISEKVIDDTVYRDLTLSLRWEPATPEFLQIYLEEYLPYWENRIPYRLFWDAHYEVCDETCSTFSDAGEFLPRDIENLSPSLAADVNFNDVPAAFWNVNINP